MLQPCGCADGGYGIYDESVLTRLRFILAGKEAGVVLNDLASLCKALDEQDEGFILRQITAIKAELNEKPKILVSFQSQLNEVRCSTNDG